MMHTPAHKSNTEALPPLPDPIHMGLEEVDWNEFVPVTGYTADQMRAYARQALAQPAASGEPVAHVGDLIIQVRERVMAGGAKNRDPLYTAQPAPARVPLTDAQIRNMWAHECVRQRLTRELVQAFARAIEAAHGITAKEAP